MRDEDKELMEWLASQGSGDRGMSRELQPGFGPSGSDRGMLMTPEGKPSENKDIGVFDGNDDGKMLQYLAYNNDLHQSGPAYGDAGRPRTALPEEAPKSAPVAEQMSKNNTMLQAHPVVHDTAPKHAEVTDDTSGFDLGDNAGLILSMFADMAINKGRGGQDILKWYAGAGDRNLDSQFKKAQIAKMNADATTPKGTSPELLELQRQRLELANDKYKDTVAKTGEQKAKEERENDINSPDTKAAQDALINAGFDETKARSMTATQIYKFRPQLGQRSSQEYGNELWGQHFTTEEKARRAAELRAEGRDARGERRREDIEIAKEERQIPIRQDERSQDFKEKFIKERGPDLDIAALVQDVESAPGGVPPTFFERFRSQLTARGIPKERLQAWQAKQMIIEIWSRSQSGAAISQTEDGKFLTQVGMDPTASPESVEAAYAVLKNITSRRLKGFASVNPGAAREVAAEYGLDTDAWIGPPQDEDGLSNFDVPANLGTTEKIGPKVNKVIHKKRPEKSHGRVHVRDPKSGRTAWVDDTPELHKRIDAGVLELMQ